MRLRRSLALLVPLCLVAACADGSTGVIASDGPGALDGQLRVRRWSDPRAWPEGRVPVAGETVVVPAGSATVPAYFLRFLAYKNSGRGVWLRRRAFDQTRSQ